MKSTFDEELSRHSTVDASNTLQITKNTNDIIIAESVKGIGVEDYYLVRVHIGKWKALWAVFKWLFFEKS